MSECLSLSFWTTTIAKSFSVFCLEEIGLVARVPGAKRR